MTPSRPVTGLYEQRPRTEVVQDLTARARRHLLALPEATRIDRLEDALYQERKRLERSTPEPGEEARLDRLATALVRGTDSDRLEAGVALARSWADEIHGRFDRRTYRLVSRLAPPALGAFLSGRGPGGAGWDPRPDHRVRVEGPTELLRTLADEATIVLAPTHVSNLDSPIIGLALTLAGLPPFLYGAGLNLFDNHLLGWWMARLGAYTVDRTKAAQLYKDVLKDYSVYQLVHRHHSLFFPGGTRSRSGAVETRVKKGLLGTGVLAWQEMLAAGRPDAEIYVVPMTLSYTLCLEASTLIEDALADLGRQRYIISDDEFSQSTRIAAFVQRVLSLDASIVCRFGQPLDVLGHPVSPEAATRAQQAEHRRAYVCARDGSVEWDAQRDRVYTDMLADALVDAWPRDVAVMATHLVAAVHWKLVQEAMGTTDTFRLVRATAELRALPRALVLARVARALESVDAAVAAGALTSKLPATAEATVATALDAFGRYHETKALAERGDTIVMEDPSLCLYYANRLAHAPALVRGEA